MVEAHTSKAVKRKCQKGYDIQLRSVIRDKTYTRVKFVRSKQLALYVAELGLDTGYVKIPIDWKERNFEFHLKKHVYRAYNQMQRNSQSLMRK